MSLNGAGDHLTAFWSGVSPWLWARQLFLFITFQTQNTPNDAGDHKHGIRDRRPKKYALPILTYIVNRPFLVRNLTHEGEYKSQRVKAY